ncbi:DUF3667 domain-containing protein [Polaribacter batillariae]|uniref:DUF3667 domain-containing protein n=1 Tax=Polaribacter batillariae TaxID=2808900 RepID=A0ABX7SUD3_9FLAO|nr:DUF3667 domain-containing protein [Polaribacter batillariae]QTD36448.1 DUF3667 domain-containing protein [Polaribacter batillariae]
MAEICKNCGTEITQNYCPICGNPANLKRIDAQYIFQEIRDVLNFEKGLLFTIRELTINPGRNIRAFLHENRNRLVKPILFLIITSLIYTLSNKIFNFEDGYINYSGNEQSTVINIFKWIQGNYGYANIILAIFIGLWLKLFFRRYQFNFFEILILLCFVIGMGMLIFSVFGIVQSLTQVNLMQVGAVGAFIYTTYALGHFFNKRKFLSYVKAFFAYLLGMITFSLAAIAIGLIIDLIIQK